MSIATGAVAVEKWRSLRRAERTSDAFLAAWRAAPDAVGVAALTERFAASPVATLIAAVSAAEVATDHAYRAEIHDRIVRRHVLAMGSDLRRGLPAIATVGSTAPFVGLFGTVIGIVNAFHEIGATGRGGIATVSTGIAEALVTTAFGIMVAIPAVWAFNLLSQRIARLLTLTECAGQELVVRRLTASRPSRASAAADEDRR
jgi:biopolymer transport protein ExbB/TolQ